MPYSSDEDDPDDDELDEGDDDREDVYISCPHCRGTMLEAADYCPQCQRWITREDLPPKRQPLWIVIVALILLATFLFAVLPL